MPPRAVLFAFDGVLADTENVHVAAWQRTLRALGWVEPDETCARAGGIGDVAFVAEVFARRKVEGGDLTGWARRKRELTTQLLRDRPTLRRGVAPLVQALREAGVRLGIVTAAPREHVEVVLAASGLLDAFDAIVGADDLATPTPDPSDYRLALDRLGLIHPREAVAVEEAPPGIVTAGRAGLRVVAVASPPVDRDDQGPDPFPDLADSAAMLAEIGL